MDILKNNCYIPSMRSPRLHGEASRKRNVIYIVPLDPAYKAWLAGHLLVIGKEKKMESSAILMEGVGKGRLDRIVMGKLGMDIDLLEGIREIVKKEKIQTGIILSAVGALKKAIFRNLKILPSNLKVEDRHRLYLELEQPLEIVSLTGWMATKEDDEIEIHAHFSASTVMKDKIVTLGGHLTPGTITSIKVVIVIGVIEDTSIKAGLDPRINQMDITF